ncbi:hypothetical protein C8R31_105188 [Nitrosospira sp. Nsp2]|nr:hypothetical protein C8R31_105188 [Nitrosospira sp. Nsp2]
MLPFRSESNRKRQIDHLRFSRPGARSRMNNARISIALVLLGSILVTPAIAWSQSHSGLAFGLGFLGGHGSGYYGRVPYFPYDGYPPRYGFTPWYGFGPYYSYGSSYPPVVVEPSPPPVYIQQQQVSPPQPRAPAAYYWHYCHDPEGYYPYVTNCPGGWLQVVPRPDQ